MAELRVLGSTRRPSTTNGTAEFWPRMLLGGAKSTTSFGSGTLLRETLSRTAVAMSQPMAVITSPLKVAKAAAAMELEAANKQAADKSVALDKCVTFAVANQEAHAYTAGLQRSGH